MKKIRRTCILLLIGSTSLLLTSCEALLMTAALGLGAAAYMPYTTPTYPVATGTAFTPIYTDYSGGTSTYSGTTTGTSTSSSTSSTSSSRECVFCNGTGKIVKRGEVSTFGLSNTVKYCDVCGEKLVGGEYHAHVNCTHCHGTGRVQ